jgi:hypothetical protein
MKDVGQWLRDADPLGPGRDDSDAPGLSPADAHAIRRAMLTALDTRTPAPLWWPHPLAIAATVALTLATGVVVGRRLPPPREPRDAPAMAHAGGGPIAGELRQLQFATPGGTRVIWVFNPDFQP